MKQNFHGSRAAIDTAIQSETVVPFPALPNTPFIALEPWQYRLTSGPHEGGNQIGAYWLSVGPDLPRISVEDADGNAAGLLLGFPIDLRRKHCISGTWTLPRGINPNCEAGQFAALTQLGGRFIWICLTPETARIYPDAATGLSCVWDRSGGSAGATTLAILDGESYAARFDHKLFAALGRNGESWFPAGLTAHSGVTRLLPNHFLDLKTWMSHRFDASQVLPSQQTPDDVVEGVIEVIQAQLAALFQQGQTPAFAFSAGYGSRTILACAAQSACDHPFLTVQTQRTESDLATELAAHFGLKHRGVPQVMATRAEQERFLRRSGHCCGGSNLRYHVSLHESDAGRTFISGLGSVLGIAPLSRDEDQAGLQITPQLLLGRMGLKPNEKMVRYMAYWIGRLGDVDASQVLDLCYLENVLGPAAMSQFCADPHYLRLNPFLTYPTCHMMMNLPDDWKHANALPRAIIGRLWPELLQYPFPGVGRGAQFTRQHVDGFPDVRHAFPDAS